MDEKLVEALNDLVEAEANREEGEDWFFTCASQVAYRWIDYLKNPVKPDSGPFRMGITFRLNEDGTSDVESN